MFASLRRPALLAGLTALLLSMPATALAQPTSASPPPARAALARVWQQIHQVRGVPEPASLSGRTARKATAAQLTSGYPGVLAGVSTVPSSSKAWAVGADCVSACGTATEVDATLVLHYDGTSWTQVASPNPGGVFSELAGVKALSDTNVWAVGDYCVSSCSSTTTQPVEHTLILHWNGTAWQQVTSKNPSSSLDVLLSVTAASSGDVWAAGLRCNSGCTKPLTLTEHWNGTSWSTVSSPNPSSNGDLLSGVSSFPTHKAWTVGSAGVDNLALRWTGTKWASATVPNPNSASNELLGVSATSGSNAWAVGTYSSTPRTLALHWNGTKWSKVSTPNPSSAYDALEAVAARTGSDAWAVGESCASACGQPAEADNPLIIHWNGSSWSAKTAPGGGTGYLSLYSVAASSASNAWAVGIACSSGCGTSSEVDSTLIEHWNGSAWLVS